MTEEAWGLSNISMRDHWGDLILTIPARAGTEAEVELEPMELSKSKDFCFNSVKLLTISLRRPINSFKMASLEMDAPVGKGLGAGEVDTWAKGTVGARIMAAGVGVGVGV